MPVRSETPPNGGPLPPAPALERMTGRQRLLLLVVLAAQFMLAVDFSILTVALPTVGNQLGFAASNLQWVVTAFLLPAAGLTLMFGRVADLFGRRRLFLAGMALLAVGSLVGGLATSPAMLLAGRAVQGLAAAAAVPAGLSILTTSFPEGPLRERALGLNGALLVSGFAFGSVLGGVLTDLLSWRWAFLINLPIAVGILIAAPRVISESRNPRRTRLDVPGAVSVSGGLLALVYGITAAQRDGWASASAVLSLAAAAALLVAFWFIELHSPHPLAPLRVLKRRTVAWGNFGGLIVVGMTSAVVFQMTLYLQDVLGYSPLTAGLAFGAASVMAVVGGLAAPWLIGRVGAHRSLAIALTIQGLGLAAMLSVGESRSGLYIVGVALAVAFFGHAYGLVSYTVTATSGLPDEEQGLATGLSTMSLQIALTLGIPVLSAIALARTGSLDGSTSNVQATLDGMHLAVLVGAGITMAAAALIAIFLRPAVGETATAADPLPARTT